MVDFTYSSLDKHLHDKDTYTRDFMTRLLNMTDSMFEYTGLPDTVPSSQLERQLKCNGSVGFIRHDGELYALSGAPVNRGTYNEPIDYQISNTYLNLSNVYTVGTDVAIVANDSAAAGIVPIVAKYAVAICDTEISLDTVAILSRITMLITAPDDKSKAAADEFVKKIGDGEFSVIGDNAFFSGVKLSTPSTQSATRINDIVTLLQYYKASMFNELGLQANWNTKRENLNMDEVGMNVDVLLPLADNMLKERREGVERVNELFGTDIAVEFGSAWKTLQEQSDAETDLAETMQVVTIDPSAGDVSRETIEVPPTNDPDPDDTPTPDPQSDDVSRETIDPDPDDVSRETPDPDDVSRETTDPDSDDEKDGKDDESR